MEVQVSSRPPCLTLSFGSAVSTDPGFYVQQMRYAESCKNAAAAQLVLRFDHAQPDGNWGPIVQETFEAACSTSNSRNLCLQIMGGTPNIPAELANAIEGKYQNVPFSFLEVMLVGVDAQVEAMTSFLHQLSKVALNVKKLTLGFSWFHPRAEHELHRLSHAVCNVVESQVLKVETLNFSKIHFKGSSLCTILRSIERHPVGLEIGGFAETRSFWPQLGHFRSKQMLSLSPYSGHDFPIVSLLQTNRHLCSLTLDLFRCEPSQAFQPSELVKAFHGNTSVHTLCLKGCRNGYQVSFLTELLPTVRHVKKVELGYIDFNHVREGQWPTSNIVQSFRQNFSVQSFLLHRHRKETSIDTYSLFSSQEEEQIRHCLQRNKSIVEWSTNPFDMPKEYLPHAVAIAMANKNPTLVLDLFQSLNVNIGPFH